MDFLNFVILITKPLAWRSRKPDYPKYGTPQWLRGAIIRQASEMTLSPLADRSNDLKVLVRDDRISPFMISKSSVAVVYQKQAPVDAAASEILCSLHTKA